MTEFQTRVYEFIKDYMLANNYPPSLPEVADGLFLSLSTIQYHFDKLVEDGYIVEIRNDKNRRSGHYYVKGMRYVFDETEVQEKK